MSETRDLVSGLNPVDQWARVPPPPLPTPNLQTPTAGAPTVPPPANPSAQVADFYSKEFNLPPYVGAGIAEYMKTRESGLNPLAYNPNDRGSPSAGIAQWRGDRLNQLSQQPNATTLEGQLQFSAQELRGSEKSTLDALKKARNQQEAFDIWKTSYERPAEFQMGHGWATEDRSRYQDQHDSSMGMAREYMRLANEELPGSKERAQLLMQARDEAHKATEAFNWIAKTPPIYKPNDIAENFGSVAVLLSVLGGMFAKRPFTASLAAAGQAMQAQNQQNYDQFKIANEQWHTQAQLGLDQVKLAHDEIKEVLDDERLEFNEKQARLQSILQGYQMGEQARWHDIEYQHMLNQDRLANYTRGVETVQRQQTLNLFNELEAARATGDPDKIADAQARADDWNKSQGKGLTIAANPQHIALEKFLAENPNASSQEVQQFLQTGRGARSGPALAVQKFIQENPGATANDVAKFYSGLQAEVSATRNITSGKAADTVRTFSVSVSHLDVLQDAADALKNGDIQRFNAGKQRLAAEFGDPAPTNFDAVRTIVGSEVNKAIQGGVGALTDREELRGSFERANSPEQLNGVIHNLKRLIAGQLEGYRREYQDILSPEEFDRKLSPAAKRELGALAPSGGGGSYNSPDDIYKAFDAGSLTKEQAKQLLIDKFGYKP